MTRRHVYTIERMAHRLRGRVECLTRRGQPAETQEGAAFARVVVARPELGVRHRVEGWRLGAWRERDPGEWTVECWPEGVERG